MEKEKYYIRNKIFTYRDLTTNTYLEVSVDASSEANGTWINLNPATICFSIYDPKVNKTVSSICICLRYNNAVLLVESVNNLFANMNSKENIFSNGSVIQIPQYTLKNRKELILNFACGKENKPIIQLTIIDSTSQRGRAVMGLDFNAFKSIGKILKEFVDSPISTNISIKQLLSYDRSLDNLTCIKDEICKKLEDINNTMNSAKVNMVDLDEYKDEQTELSDLQKEFNKEYKEFSKIDLGLDKVVKKTEETTKVIQPFISTCLQYDLNNLNGLMTSFICTTEKSSWESFVPFDFIFNSSYISREDKSEFTDTFGYYPVQYALIFLLKKYVKEAVSTGTYPNNIPALSFGKKFKRNTPIYNLSKEIITIFLVYSIIVNSFKDETDEIKRTYFAMKLLFSAFMFSIEVDDKLYEELSMEYDKCYDSGMFRTIQDDYASESYGGSVSISKEVFESCCKSFVETLKNKNTRSFNTKEDIISIFKEYDVNSPRIPIESGEDIKVVIFESTVDWENEYTGTNAINITNSEAHGVKIVESSTSEAVHILDSNNDYVENDSKLILFLDSIKGIAENKLVEDISNSCKVYEDLTKFFKTRDIPHELFKIKRVIDMDPTLSDKTKVLKKSKLLKEDIDVTETRAMQDESIVEFDEGFDVQDILSMDGI